MNLADYVMFALALGMSSVAVWASIERAGRKDAERALASNRQIVAAIEESHILLNGPKMNGHGAVEDVRTTFVPADTDPRMHVS